MKYVERWTKAGPILEIHMQSDEVQCWLCGCVTECGWGVPTYNGDLVSNDFPDWMWAGGGGSQAVCERCYRRHERGEAPTCDHYYVTPGPCGPVLVDGAGI